MWIAYVIGAAIGQITHGINAAAQYDEISDYIDDLKEEKERALEELTLDYENAKTEANKNADRSDAQSTMNESLTSTDVNNSLDNLQLEQIAEGFSYNQQAQQIASNTGNELSNIAASGIRAGGSISDAVKLEQAQNNAQLQLTEDMQRQNNDLQLSNVLAGLNNNIFGIQADRTDARDLRDSFSEGGYQWKKYQLAYENTEAGYNQAIKKAKTERKHYDASHWEFWLDNFKAGLSMGASIGGTANSISQTIKNGSKVNYGTETNNNSSMLYTSIGNSNYNFGTNYDQMFAGFTQPQFKTTFKKL